MVHDSVNSANMHSKNEILTGAKYSKVSLKDEENDRQTGSFCGLADM